MITDQMKAKSDNFWKMYDQLFSMQLEVLVRHSGSRLSFEVEPSRPTTSDATVLICPTIADSVRILRRKSRL